MTIFIERLQATVTADISDATRKLQQIKDQSKAAIRDMSGTATIKLNADTTGMDTAKAKLKVEAEGDAINIKLKADADTTSEDVAHAEMQAKADLNPINIKVKTDSGGSGGLSGLTGMLGGLAGGLAGITGLSLDSSLSPNITAMAVSLAGLSSYSSAATAGIAGLGGALLASLPSTVAMAGALASLLPVAGAGFLAFSGISNALQKYSTAIASGTAPTAALQKATAGLTAEQKTFVTQLIGLKPILDGFKQQMAAIVLPAVSTFLHGLTTTGLPVLKEGLTGAATGLASFISQLGKMLGAKSTVDMFHQLNAANTVMIQNWGGAGVSVIHTFITALAAVSPVSIAITKSIADGAAKFDAWVTSVAKSGQLASVVGQSWNILRTLLDGVGSALTAVMHVVVIGMPGIQVFANAFKGLFEHMKDSVGPGAAAISSFFQSVGQFGTQLGGALQSLGPGLASIVEALGKLASTAVGPALQTIGPALSTLATAVAGTFLPALQTLVPLLGTAIASLGTGLAGAITAVAPQIKDIAGSIGVNLVNAIQTISPMLPGLLSAVVNIVNQFSPILPVIATLAQTLLPPLTVALDALNTSVGNLMPSITTIITMLGQGLANILTTLAPTIPPLADGLNKVLTAVEPLIPPLAQFIALFSANLVKVITDLTPLLTSLVEGIAGIAVPVLDFANAILKIPSLGPYAAEVGAIAIAFALWGTQIDAVIVKLAIAPIENFIAALSLLPAALASVGDAMAFVSVAGGPILIGLAAIAVVIGAVTHGFGLFSSGAKEAGQSWAQTFLSDLPAGTNKLQAAQSEIVTMQGNLDSSNDAIKRLGDAMRTMPTDLLNTQVGNLSGQWASLGQHLIADGIDPTTKVSAAMKEAKGDAGDYTSKIKDLNAQLPGLGWNLGVAADAQDAANRKIGEAHGLTGDAATQFGVLSTQLSNAKSHLDDVNGSIDTYLGKALGMAQNTDTVWQAINNFTDSLKPNTKIINDNGTAAVNNRLALDNIANSILQNVIPQMQKQGATSDQIKQKVGAFTSSLLTQAGTIDTNLVPQIQAYLTQLGLTPDQIATTIKTMGGDKANQDVDTFQTKLKNAAKTYTATLQVNGQVFGTYQQYAGFLQAQGKALHGGTNSPGGMATGGTIGGARAGFKTASMAVVGEDGSGYPEYVIPTNPVHRTNAMKLMGGLMGALGMAGGGVVQRATMPQAATMAQAGPVNATLEVDQVVAPGIGDAVQAGLGAYMGSFVKNVVTISQAAYKAIQAAQQAAGLGSLMSWLGVPYLWGGGHGVPEAVARARGVDCSGLVNQVYGVSGTTEALVNMGTPVAGLGASLPGDWVFYGSPPFHMGVIVTPGGSTMIDALHAGTNVEYDNVLSIGNPSAIRRIGGASLTPAGGASAWTGVASQVATMLGQPGSTGAVVRRINFESAGNPIAVNKTDSNWIAGHPSVGLAQVIDSTFHKFAGPFVNTGPYIFSVSIDPMANVYAGMNYATQTYGSIANVDPLVRPRGYDSGGLLPPGITMAVNNTGRPEVVLPPPSVGAPSPPMGGASLHIENMYVNDQTDVDMMLNQLDFHYQMGGGL